MKIYKHILFVFLFTLVFTMGSTAQVKLGTDIYSQYVWRGSSFCGEAFQPALSYTAGAFSVGVWGSYSAPSAAAYSETDLWASYVVGPVTISVTDYFIPVFITGGDDLFFDYNTKKGLGSHTVEAGVSYTGPETMPLTISAYYNAIGGSPDPDNSSYVQVSYPFSLETTSLTAIVGFTPSKSTAWYVTQKAGLINVGLQASKTIKVSESFSIPFNVQYIFNPYAEKTYLVFGISL
jgi:hypothetical protein